MRRAAAYNAAVLAVGLAGLGVVLFFATTVDARPPRVTSFSLSHHLAAADSVALTNAAIEVVFSEPVDHASAERAFNLEPAVEGTFSWRGSVMSFTPDQRLPLETEFRAWLEPDVRDASGNLMGSRSDEFRFRTVGRPLVARTDPVEGGEVAPDAAIVLTFSTLMDTASVERALDIRPAVAYVLRWSGETLTIVPQVPLTLNERYEVRLDYRASDLAGNRLFEPFELTFTTLGDTLDATSVVPADGVSGISVATSIAIGFDEPIDPATIDGVLTIEPEIAGSLAVADPDGASAVGGTAPQTLLRFQPAGPLPANTTFQVELSTGLRSVDGSVLAEPMAWSFTTGAPSPSLRNQVLFLTDRSGVRNLWAMNPDGTNQHQISTELSPVTAYAPSPDGRRLVVGDGVRLIELRADGGERTVITDEGAVEFDPTYHPDGTQLAFGRADAATGAGLGLWIRAAGAEPQPLEPSDPPAAADGGPDTSPSASGAPAASQAQLLRAPRYSPDGRFLAFVDTSGVIGVVELDGRELTTAPFVALATPTWRPDSAAALFAGEPSDPGSPPGELRPAEPVAPLSPGRSFPPDELRVVSLEPGAARATTTSIQVAAVIVPGEDVTSYLRLDAQLPDGIGSLWSLDERTRRAREVSPAGRLLGTSIAPTPDADRLVLARTRLASGGRTAAPNGIWLVDVTDGDVTRLSTDGDTPTWLP